MMPTVAPAGIVRIDVAQNGLAVVFVVAEPHVVEYDAAVLNMGDGVFRRRDVRRLVEQLGRRARPMCGTS